MGFINSPFAFPGFKEVPPVQESFLLPKKLPAPQSFLDDVWWNEREDELAKTNYFHRLEAKDQAKESKKRVLHELIDHYRRLESLFCGCILPHSLYDDRLLEKAKRRKRLERDRKYRKQDSYFKQV